MYDYLSNSSQAVHYERNIEISPLGKVFNKHLSEALSEKVVVSTLYVSDTCIAIVIKVRDREGGMFGRIFSECEPDVSNIVDPTCATVWNCLLRSLSEIHTGETERLRHQIDGKSMLLKVDIYDFEKRSRIGYFMENCAYLEQELKKKYRDLRFILRCKDDRQYAYLIFGSDEDLNKAVEKYGIERINKDIQKICRRQDTYHVFKKPLPLPDVTTKQAVEARGAVMGIMMNHPGLPWF